MSVLPRRFLRLRFLPRDRLCRRPALPALILPDPVMRKRFTALRFVFNFGILRSFRVPAKERRVVHALPRTVKPSAPRRAGRPPAAAGRRSPERRSVARPGGAGAVAEDAAWRRLREPWPAGTAASAGSGRGS